MVSYNFQPAGTEYVDDVLILIVVEDGLVPIVKVSVLLLIKVLILIVVEDGLVPDGAIKMGLSVFTVLILIVVEDGLVLNDFDTKGVYFSKS